MSVDWQPATFSRRARCTRCGSRMNRSARGWLVMHLVPELWLCPDCAALLACEECGQPVGPVRTAQPAPGQTVHLECIQQHKRRLRHAPTT